MQLRPAVQREGGTPQVELVARAIQYSSREGENVLDLFGGSGSTLIAWEQTGRNAYLMDLDPPFCEVIVQRWENLTGKKAGGRTDCRKGAMHRFASGLHPDLTGFDANQETFESSCDGPVGTLVGIPGDYM